MVGLSCLVLGVRVGGGRGRAFEVKQVPCFKKLYSHIFISASLTGSEDFLRQ